MKSENIENLNSLMAQAGAGDAEAFDRIYTEFLTPVYRYVYLRTQNRQLAEDLTQTVFIKAFESLPRFVNQHRQPLAYFFTIARNAIIDFRRKRQIELAEFNDEIIQEIEDVAVRPDMILIQDDDRTEIQKALAELSEDESEVITLKFMNGLPNREIAEILGKTEANIRKIQSRAIQNLRILLKGSS